MWKRASILIFATIVAAPLIAGIMTGGVRITRNYIDNTLDARSVTGCAAEALNMTTAPAAFEYGDSYFGGERGYDLTCARAGFARAVELDPRGHLLAWHQFGRTDFLLGNFNNAIFKFQKQEEYFGDALPNVHYMLGLTYGYRARETGNIEDWGKAEEEFKAYLAIDPLGPWARVDLAWVLFSQGKYQDMKPILEEGLLNHPGNAWLLNMYGLALLNTGDRFGAQKYFEAALSFARALTPEIWGISYPGNDPQSWSDGLEEMIRSIERNLEIASSPEES